MNQKDDIDNRETGRNRSWALNIVASVPLMPMALLLVINAEYLSQLWDNLPPRIGQLPCGWVVLATIAALVILTRVVLWLANAINWLPGTILLAAVAFVLMLVALFMFLLGPAAFQVLRNEAVRQLFG